MSTLNTSFKLALPSLLLLSAPPLMAADNNAVSPEKSEAPITSTPAAAQATQAGLNISGLITPKLYYFDYTDGPVATENNNHFFQQFVPMESSDGETGSGVFPELDLDLTASDASHVFTMQREAHGQANQHNNIGFEHEKISASAYYNTFATGANGADSILTANKRPNEIERTNLGTNLTFKPALLGEMMRATLAYDGILRRGSQYETYAPNPGSTSTFNSANLIIDDQVHKVSLSLSASPFKLFDIAYEGSRESFKNYSTLNASGPAGVYLATTDTTGSVSFFIPDTSQVTHSLRASKQFGERTLLSLGLASSTLEQETFYGTTGSALPGEITNTSTYLTLHSQIPWGIGAEAFIKRNKRDNDLKYNIGSSLLVPNMSADLSEYGLSLNRPLNYLNSTLSLAYKYVDHSRQLPVTTSDPIFFKDETRSNEVMLKWNARPTKGLNVQISPSYTWSNDTGLPTEPEKSFQFKTSASYITSAGLLISGYYNYRHTRNNEQSITETATVSIDTTPLSSINQRIDDKYHTAGASISYAPTENINTSASVFWNQTDAETYYIDFLYQNLSSQTGIYYANLINLLNYKVNSTGATLNADWQATDNLMVRGAYSYLRSQGDTAEPNTPVIGAVPAFLDNTIHSISLGAEYRVSKTTMLQGIYQYEHYEDDAYPTLDGGLHTLMLGLSLKF